MSKKSIENNIYHMEYEKLKSSEAHLKKNPYDDPIDVDACWADVFKSSSAPNPKGIANMFLNGADINTQIIFPPRKADTTPEINSNVPITPITWGIKNKHIEFVEFLIHQGANLEKAPWVAIANGNSDILEILIGQGIDLTKTNLTLPINMAITNNYIKTLEILVKIGVNIDTGISVVNPEIQKLITESQHSDQPVDELLVPNEQMEIDGGNVLHLGELPDVPHENS